MRHPLLFLALLAAPILRAQDVPLPPPPQVNVPHDATLNPKLPTIFIVGDSTARNGADLGWGDHFAALFNTAKVNIANRAVAGRSCRTYMNEGRWTNTLAEIKPGDFVLIQMGHNDGGGTPDGIRADTKGRSSLKGTGEDTVDIPITKPYTTGPLAGKTTETVRSYGSYLRQYIAEARAKGATPILLTVTARNVWKPDSAGTPQIERDMGYTKFETEVAEAQHVPLADMAKLETDYYQPLGPEKTALNFPIDHTHTSPTGATLNAHFVAQALRNIHSPIAAYLLPSTKLPTP